jgi:hypothetical protein
MSTSPLSQKPGRNGAASSALGIRMDKEFLAIQGHLKRAKNYTLAPQRRRSPSGARGVSSTPRKTTSRAKASTEAAYQTRITAPEANSKQQQHPYLIPPAVPGNKLRPVEASTSSSQKRGRDVDAAPSSALQLRMDEELPVLQGLLKKVKPLPPSTSLAADDKKNYAPSPAGRSSTSGAPVVSRGHDVDATSSSSSALQLRMDEELPVLHDILKKVKPLPPSTSPAADKKKNYAPSPAGRSSTSGAPVVSRGHDVDAASSSALQLRMDEELPVLHDILKKVKPLPPSTSPAADKKKNYAPSPAGRSSTSVAPVLSSTANTTTSQPNAETEFVYQKEREEFRQMLMEMEKSALRDETIYPEDLQELGLSRHWYMS